MQTNLPSIKHTYKLSYFKQTEQNSNASINVKENYGIENSFLTIKVKKQIYLGKQAIALHIECAS